MGKTALVLIVITLISKITGLVREQFFTYFLGTGQYIDIYNTASTIPYVLFSFIISGVVAGFIPIYSRISREEGEIKATEFTSNLINILLIIATAIIAIAVIFAPQLVSIFAPAYTEEKRMLSIQFTRIMSLAIYTSIISSVLIGFLQIKNRFIVAELPGTIMNFFIILFLMAAVYFKNYYILPVGYVITELLKYMLFPKALAQEGYRHSFKINFKDPNLKKMLIIAIPIVLSIAAVDISTISDQSYASKMLDHGGVSIMRIAALLLQLVNGVLVVSITTTNYPLLSRYASENKLGKFKQTIMNSSSLALILVIPAMVGIMILSTPIIKLLFERGSFDAESTRLTSGVLLFYMPTIIGQAISNIFKRGFYALQNTKTPIIITIVQVATNVILNGILSQIWGLNGLAMATSISSFLGGSLAIILFKTKYGNLKVGRMLITLIKILFAAGLMGLVTYSVYNALSGFNYIFALIMSVIFSIAVYGIVIVFMRIPEVKKELNRLYRKFKK